MIAALIVTHNSHEFLGETLASIRAQTQQPDITIAIDDHSTDNTTQILHAHGFTTFNAETTSTDTTTRIAQNFVQGVTIAADLGASIIILGDHDDTWRPHRVAHQAGFLIDNPHISMLASDGQTTPDRTLRSTFPVPADFNERSREDQWRYVAKHSIATGGASALAPARLSTIAVPEGWLHDRWWSQRAVRENSMAIDSTVVIDYRLSDQQQVGLDTQGQGNVFTSLAHKLTDLPRNLRKMKDIAALLSEE